MGSSFGIALYRQPQQTPCFNLNSAVGRLSSPSTLGSKALATNLLLTFRVSQSSLCGFVKNLNALSRVAPFAKDYGH